MKNGVDYEIDEGNSPKDRTRELASKKILLVRAVRVDEGIIRSMYVLLIGDEVFGLPCNVHLYVRIPINNFFFAFLFIFFIEVTQRSIRVYICIQYIRSRVIIIPN